MNFVEAVKTRKRMCAAKLGPCDSYCPLYTSNNGTGLPCRTFIETYPEEAEKLIAKWAEDHPANTNKDKFYEIFPDFPVDIVEMTKTCRANCASYPRCNGCNRKKAIDFWKEEYEEE